LFLFLSWFRNRRKNVKRRRRKTALLGDFFISVHRRGLTPSTS